jgi:hypothetical protein
MSTIVEAKELARGYMKAGIPSFMEGPPGVGKSESWEQIAKEEGMSFICVELNQLDPVDLRGLPLIEKEADGTPISRWARPEFLPEPKKHGEFGIILFDEMADLSKAMQSAAYSPILKGTVGPHVIPPFDYAKRTGWYRAAAGNRRGDKAAAQPMSTALASRFGWIEIEADVGAFVQWADKNDISPLLIGFLRFKESMIHNMDNANEKAFPCPRQWARVSRIMDAPPAHRFLLMKGLVGEGAATEFEGFIKTTTLPDLKDILANPAKCDIPKGPGDKYALSSFLARNINKENFDKIAAYIKREQFGRDFEICTILDATKRDAGLTETKAFTEFSVRNQDLTT